MQLTRSGWFRRAQVLWLGPDEAPAGAVALATALGACQRRCGLEPEERPFQLHVTLARRARRPPRRRTVEPLPWPVGEFCLVVSNTGSGGATYEVLRRWPLSAT